jgi:thiol-disulfide isomerase/thioredoxin
VKPWVTPLLVVAAVAAGVAAYTLRKPASVETPAGPFAESATSQLAETLPSFQLADRDGTMRSLADWPDQSLIVNFWATWCAPCRREIPLLQKLQREHGAEHFQVIGVAVDFRDKVLAYADEMQIDYPLLIGEQEALDAASSFGIEAVGLPFTVFSDRRGRIVTAHLGELTESEAALILDAVRHVNAGKRSPEQARTELEAALAALPAPPEEAE